MKNIPLHSPCAHHHIFTSQISHGGEVVSLVFSESCVGARFCICSSQWQAGRSELGIPISCWISDVCLAFSLADFVYISGTCLLLIVGWSQYELSFSCWGPTRGLGTPRVWRGFLIIKCHRSPSLTWPAHQSRLRSQKLPCSVCQIFCNECHVKYKLIIVGAVRSSRNANVLCYSLISNTEARRIW